MAGQIGALALCCSILDSEANQLGDKPYAQATPIGLHNRKSSKVFYISDEEKEKKGTWLGVYQ